VLSGERLEPSTGEISTIGLDTVQVHVAGAVVIRKRVSRPKVLEYFGELPPCLIGSMRVRQPTTAAASLQRLVTRLNGYRRAM
jgi:hypothetical protein